MCLGSVLFRGLDKLGMVLIIVYVVSRFKFKLGMGWCFLYARGILYECIDVNRSYAFMDIVSILGLETINFFYIGNDRLTANIVST